MFSGKRFAFWFVTCAAVTGSLLVLAGAAWPVALFASVMLSTVVAMLPSLQLSTPMAHSGGIRGALYRPLPRPHFIGEKFSARASELGRSAALFGLVVGLAISYLSAPWNGALLLGLGALGLWRPEIASAQSRIGAALLVVVGTFLLVHHVI